MRFLAARSFPTSFQHGTRASYVTGCRCEECRAANTAYARKRAAAAREAAGQVPAGPAVPVPQQWTAPDGTKRTRLYSRACLGVNGEPCPTSSHLTKASRGDMCGRCRKGLVWNGLVSSLAARRHLAKLARKGVGYKSAADAASVGRSIVAGIVSGRRQLIRAETAGRLLAIDEGARAGASAVGAARTWRLIDKLLEEGFSKAELARRLGLKSPAIQFKKGRILARTAARIERFYRLMVEVPA